MVHRPPLEKGVDVGVLRDIDGHAAARRMSRSRRALAITGTGRAASVFVDPSCGCKCRDEMRALRAEEEDAGGQRRSGLLKPETEKAGAGLRPVHVQLVVGPG